MYYAEELILRAPLQVSANTTLYDSAKYSRAKYGKTDTMVCGVLRRMLFLCRRPNRTQTSTLLTGSFGNYTFPTSWRSPCQTGHWTTTLVPFASQRWRSESLHPGNFLISDLIANPQQLVEPHCVLTFIKDPVTVSCK